MIHNYTSRIRLPTNSYHKMNLKLLFILQYMIEFVQFRIIDVKELNKHF